MTVATTSRNDTVSHNSHNSKTPDKNDNEQHFLSYFHESKLPSPEHWPYQSPILITSSIRAPYINYNCDARENISGTGNGICIMKEHYEPFFLPVDGQVIFFQGPLFSGRIVSRVRDIPCYDILPSKQKNSKRVGSADYFKNRSRQFQWTVQGQFKQRIRFDNVITGQEFHRPFRNTPSSKLVQRGLDLLKNKLPETFECDLFTNNPRFEHPLITGCQFFRVDKPEDVNEFNSDILFGQDNKGEINEDSSLLGDPSVPKDAQGRKKFFSQKHNLERFYFEPGLGYTFDFFANFFSPSRHSLDLTAFFSIDLIPYFNGCP